MPDLVSLTPEEINRLYSALSSELNELSIPNIRKTVGAAGIDVTRIPSPDRRATVMPAIHHLFGEKSFDEKMRTLTILAERLIGTNPQLTEDVQQILGKHGYQFIDGAFVPIGILDEREKTFLPTNSASEIARSTSRLIEGDESGAITAACGAVDLATQEIYKSLNLGDTGNVAFQAKVNTALQKLKVFETMKSDFMGVGIPENDASAISDHIKQATNQAAHALQILRRAMGDVHGSKPALRKTAYYSIKWSSAICGLFEDNSPV